jgi:predicted dehydrogenase
MMHLPLLRKRPDCFHLVALSDISRTLLRSVGALYNVPSANQFRDYHDLVNCQELEAVFILNGGSHAPQVLAAIEAGKHVLVEKPLCYTLREADEIAAAAERMRVVVMVAYMKRYDPGYRAAKTLLAGMEDVRYVQINTLHPAEDGYLSHHNVMRLDDAPEGVQRHARGQHGARRQRAAWVAGRAGLRALHRNLACGRPGVRHDHVGLR